SRQILRFPISLICYRDYPHLLSFLHDALPIFLLRSAIVSRRNFSSVFSSIDSPTRTTGFPRACLRSISNGFPCMYSSSRRGQMRSEEHTSELQSRGQLVCRLLLENKKLAAIRKHSSSSATMSTNSEFDTPSERSNPKFNTACFTTSTPSLYSVSICPTPPWTPMSC